MCGIAGIASINENMHNFPIKAVTDTLAHRGPDGCGYWDLVFTPDLSKDEAHFINGFLELFQESVKMRLISDVPLGAFLSGGIDSSAVVAMMSRVSPEPVKTFCMGFGGNTGGYLDERRYARMVAERYGTDHAEYEVVPDLEGLVEKIVCGFDEPFADDSAIPSYFVCEIARRKVTVALSGLGGDEAFAGYERYLGFNLRRIYSFLPYTLRNKVVRKLVEKSQNAPMAITPLII